MELEVEAIWVVSMIKQAVSLLDLVAVAEHTTLVFI
jgi:hypothetical protein